jgi:hypothetical protein
MVTTFLVASCLMGNPPMAVATDAKELSFAKSVRRFRTTESGFRAEQPGQYQFSISDIGRVQINDFAVRAFAIGSGKTLVPIATPSSETGTDANGWSKLTFSRPNIREWFVNEERGLHHWFEIAQKPSGNGNLTISMTTVGGSISDEGNNRIDVKTNKWSVTYSGIQVWDAKGNTLDSSLRLVNGRIEISVQDQNAIYPVTIDPTWEQRQVLAFTDPTVRGLGRSIAIDGDTAVVGAPLSSGAGYGAGTAAVYVNTGGVWNLQWTLVPPVAGTGFGGSVDIDGDLIVVGASGEVNAATTGGTAYVYQRSGTDWRLFSSLRMQGPEKNASFGAAVGISGGYVAVGAPLAASPTGTLNAGRVEIFGFAGSTLAREAVLNAPRGTSRDFFGASVALDGDTFVVGAPGFDSPGAANSGTAHVYRRSGGNWNLEQTLAPTFVEANGGFGDSVALSGDLAVVGEPRGSGSSPLRGREVGIAYAYERTGTSWGPAIELQYPVPYKLGRYGTGVATDGTTIVVGAPGHPSGLKANAGTAYAFAKDGSRWYLKTRLEASDINNGDQFGYDVGVSGSRILVGSRNRDIPNRDTGAVYAFGLNSAGPTLNVVFDLLGVAGTETVRGHVLLSEPVATDTVVTLTSSSPLVVPQATVTIPAGQVEARFTGTTLVTTTDVEVTVTASETGMVSGDDRMLVRFPRVGAISLNKASITAGESTIATVTLQRPATPGGITVNLTYFSLVGPASVVVPEGSTRFSFTVQGGNVTATNQGFVNAKPSLSPKDATITVRPADVYLSGISLADTVIPVNGNTTGTVTLSGPAPTGGEVVTLVSSSDRLSVPSSVTVPAGQTTATFTVTSNGTPVTGARITGTLDTHSEGATLSVEATNLVSLTASSTSCPIGGNSTITVNLNRPAFADTTVQISIQKEGRVTYPATVVIPAGSSSATFQITGVTLGSTWIYGRLSGEGTRGVQVTVFD